MRNSRTFQLSTLSAAIATTLFSGYASAAVSLQEEVIVTATRRAESLQDIPINITALGSDTIAREGISDLSDIARRVPGMTVIDQGPRSSNTLTVRGLTVDSITAPDNSNDGGDTVATYIGEIPVYMDLKLNDLERVEVLIGPQGTLYGAGTLAGAVRYIPNKPQSDTVSVDLRGDLYNLSKSDRLGGDVGATVNIPIVRDMLAVRASVDYLDDPGFIDYNFLVREAGFSNPQPDFSNPADVRANLKTKKDANTEETLSGRLALGYTSDRLDGTLTYYVQESDIGARQINHMDAFGTGEYESAHRYLEPNDKKNELLSLELVADLGFAELTSATGFSEFAEQGQRDQTDLLLVISEQFYSYYELFPTFSAFTREDTEEETFTQELRLVSTSDGPLSWIVGGFYNEYKLDSISAEFTPGFSEFAVAELGGETVRPDGLEYFEVQEETNTEKALFGEVGYQITDAWQVTVGGRWFKYKVDAKRGSVLPMLDALYFGGDPVSIDVELQNNKVNDDGDLFKINTSYDFSDDVMAYATVSEGYRLGGLNSVVPCKDTLDDGQTVCALPDEILIKPDSTVNYELGIHSQFDNDVIFNGSIFYVDWDDIQVEDFTVNGDIPITSNGGKARSRGIELAGQWLITDKLLFRGSYAFTDAELTERAPGLVDEGVDGERGDRLPGSARHQAYLALNYSVPMNDGSNVELDWSMTATSDVLTKVGERDDGEALPGFALHNVSATWYKESYTVALYADNVFDRYAVTGVRTDESFVRQVGDVDLRRYYNDVVRPRQVGLRATYHFED